MKLRVLGILLCLVFLLATPALGEKTGIPSQEAAVQSAQALLGSEYLQWELPPLEWTAKIDPEYDRAYVDGIAQNEIETISVFSDLTGHIVYIQNSFSHYLDATVGDPDGMEQDATLVKRLDEYALSFTDFLCPGASNFIEGFESPEASYYEQQRFLSVYALVSGEDGTATRTLFVVQVVPDWRVVAYSEGIPEDLSGGVG
ncbi:MAG: hypothetical protein PHI98_15750 [Eubacteriales bacterium]|nr:hypothetical protein [Eubacteriales bacterium]